MKQFIAAVSLFLASPAWADVSCLLQPAGSDLPATLLLRDLADTDEAIILVSGRTLTFDCPHQKASDTRECYGRAAPPARAPTQLNLFSADLDTGSIVVLSTRNVSFDPNKEEAFKRRRAAVIAFTVQGCDRY